MTWFDFWFLVVPVAALAYMVGHVRGGLKADKWWSHSFERGRQ